MQTTVLALKNQLKNNQKYNLKSSEPFWVQKFQHFKKEISAGIF